MENLKQEFTKMYDKIFIEALEKAGYKFATRDELLNFVKNKVEAKTYNDETTYFVEGKAFLLKKAKPIFTGWEVERVKNDFVIKADLGYDFYILGGGQDKLLEWFNMMIKQKENCIKITRDEKGYIDTYKILECKGAKEVLELAKEQYIKMKENGKH